MAVGSTGNEKEGTLLGLDVVCPRRMTSVFSPMMLAQRGIRSLFVQARVPARIDGGAEVHSHRERHRHDGAVHIDILGSGHVSWIGASVCQMCQRRQSRHRSSQRAVVDLRGQMSRLMVIGLICAGAGRVEVPVGGMPRATLRRRPRHLESRERR